jgi:hypothetical protein
MIPAARGRTSRSVHEDMSAAWRAYPNLWGLTRRIDPGILSGCGSNGTRGRQTAIS